ncbi:DUF1415 domain-containing protein [Acidovorax sp. GBBC 3334]|uniref:DUF1415 domain-containing protein n=1 Tax=Acidovorax sp. GBBC 3334 TaxID=2940496 RepID=UPI002304A7A7|nr:DUF1415 domain-containing protein [Acidovorax sp. GBBC 3334]MDA8454393.1 DUF1415 domain-containing protein [Acidovorax sp. GBBC 3334]
MSESPAGAVPTAANACTSVHQTVIEDMVRWLERAVIGLNLCPFAKAVHVKEQIHYVVSDATDARGLIEDLQRELEALAEASPERRDTTLLMAPGCMEDFLDFNDFLGLADDLVEAMDLGGILQVASFHPRFQFADTAVDDVGNATNRAPYPTLHLLREESIDRAVEAFPEAEAIFEKNIEMLEELGAEGWAALDVGPRCPVAHGAAGGGA